MVKGHTETQGDSMHSTIELAARHVNIHPQKEWCDIMNEAVQDPAVPKYIVNELD